MQEKQNWMSLAVWKIIKVSVNTCLPCYQGQIRLLFVFFGRFQESSFLSTIFKTQKNNLKMYVLNIRLIVKKSQAYQNSIRFQNKLNENFNSEPGITNIFSIFSFESQEILRAIFSSKMSLLHANSGLFWLPITWKFYLSCTKLRYKSKNDPEFT